MTFEFGPLQVDEPARIFRLAMRDVPLQPRIFDLLVYLVRHRERVVPKEELLEVLWPGVTVTENSLQRAVSMLRSVLREVGLEEVIRNFPRNGYRFCVDVLPLPLKELGSTAANAAGTISDARQAIDSQRWSDAVSLYAALDLTNALTAADLDRWALALQCLGRPSDAIPLLHRAVASHAQANAYEAAATDAATLSGIHLERGEPAVAAGWLARAEDLIAKRAESGATGRLLWMRARLAGSEGDPQRAVDLAEAAYHIGRRHGDVQIESLGLMYRGFYRLSLGQTREGLADQDHAAALALSNGVDPMTGGVLYCNVLWACRTFGDWARANQWTVSYQQFCLAGGMQVSGSCQLHRAEVLGVRGTLAEALAHVNDALSRLSIEAPWAVGDAHRVLGDIHAGMGDTQAALEAYETCHALGWDAEPGHAMLLLEQGETEAALAGLERSLIGQSWWTLQRQGMILAHLALVAAHAGRHDKAKALVENLAGQNDRWPMPSIRALTNETAALLDAERGEHGEALRHLHLARQLWTSVDARLEAARVRLQIAELLVAQLDRKGAETELRAAKIAAQALGSDKLRKLCSAVGQRLAASGVE